MPPPGPIDLAAPVYAGHWRPVPEPFDSGDWTHHTGARAPTSTGKDPATNVWCVLDAAGLDGLDEEGEPESSRDRSGYQLTGHGDKVEVSYEGRRTVRAAGEAELSDEQRLEWAAALDSRRLAEEIHRHTWWAAVNNRHSAWMALQQAAKQGGDGPPPAA